jgi:hypothetical protein
MMTNTNHIRSYGAAIAILVLTGCSRPHESASSTQVQMANLEVAINLFLTDRDRFPTNLEELLPVTNTGWHGARETGYIMASELTDAWGTPVRYSATSNSWQLRSAGSDVKFDTQDDIVKTNMK